MTERENLLRVIASMYADLHDAAFRRTINELYEVTEKEVDDLIAWRNTP